jgi:hypothetical protein
MAATVRNIPETLILQVVAVYLTDPASSLVTSPHRCKQWYDFCSYLT